jgi:hypothetical protein
MLTPCLIDCYRYPTLLLRISIAEHKLDFSRPNVLLFGFIIGLEILEFKLDGFLFFHLPDPNAGILRQLKIDKLDLLPCRLWILTFATRFPTK